jgi:uncharacterized protein YndB with AHSA1/START domain
MAASNPEPTAPATGELVITRVFDAPRELVWKAWTDPEQVVRWWGPKDYTSPVAKIDLRVGGRYLYCMRSPDGQDGWNGGVYREIVPLERIVCTVSFTDEHGTPMPASQFGLPPDWPDETVAVTTFEERDGKTTLTLRYAGIPADAMQEMMVAGWNESLDKLAASLAS